MNVSTLNTFKIVKAALESNPAYNPKHRSKILALVNNPNAGPEKESNQQVERVLRRQQVAEQLGRTVRFVDLLSAKGLLQKVTLPGSTRAIGFRASDVARLLAERPETPKAS